MVIFKCFKAFLTPLILTVKCSVRSPKILSNISLKGRIIDSPLNHCSDFRKFRKNFKSATDPTFDPEQRSLNIISFYAYNFILLRLYSTEKYKKKVILSKKYKQ